MKHALEVRGDEQSHPNEDEKILGRQQPKSPPIRHREMTGRFKTLVDWRNRVPYRVQTSPPTNEVRFAGVRTESISLCSSASSISAPVPLVSPWHMHSGRYIPGAAA